MPHVQADGTTPLGPPGAPHRPDGLLAVRGVFRSLLLAGSAHFRYGSARRGAVLLGAWLAAIATLGRFSYKLALAGAFAIGVVAAFDFLRHDTYAPEKWSAEWILRRAGTPVLLVAVAIFLRIFCVETFRMASGGMIPSVMVGDHVFADKTGWTPRRGDVVVCIYPIQPGADIIERVIGLPGDRVTVKYDHIAVNGRPLGGEPSKEACRYRDFDYDAGGWIERSCLYLDQELDGHHWRAILDDGGIRKDGEWQVPPGQLFVIGDNRDQSHDSRFWGGVPLANVKGRAAFIWRPMEGWRRVDE